MSTAEQRAWEREQQRLREQAGEEEAARLNQELQGRIGALEQLFGLVTGPSREDRLRGRGALGARPGPYGQAWAALRSSRPISEAAGGRGRAVSDHGPTGQPVSGRLPSRLHPIYRRREQELLVEYEFPRVGDIIPTDASYRYVKTRSFIEPKVRTATEVLPHRTWEGSIDRRRRS
jgi:hypothetical protein